MLLKFAWNNIDYYTFQIADNEDVVRMQQPDFLASMPKYVLLAMVIFGSCTNLQLK